MLKAIKGLTMRALHRRPTLSALTEPAGPVLKHLKHLGQLVHGFTAQAAIYLIASIGLLNLSACSSVRLIDSQVSTFSSTPAWPPDARYRFERLPSQQAQPERQTQLEDMAETALRKVGAVRSGNGTVATAAVVGAGAGAANTTATATATAPANPAKPTHIVQLTVRSQEVAASSGFGFSLLEPDYVVAGNGRLIPLYHRAHISSPLYQREVSIVLRHIGTNAVVFESKAVNDNPWPDTDAILPALLDAALQGFPNPPSGVRRVAVEIPR
jgi:hypothetical protein